VLSDCRTGQDEGMDGMGEGKSQKALARALAANHRRQQPHLHQSALHPRCRHHVRHQAAPSSPALRSCLRLPLILGPRGDCPHDLVHSTLQTVEGSHTFTRLARPTRPASRGTLASTCDSMPQGLLTIALSTSPTPTSSAPWLKARKARPHHPHRSTALRTLPSPAA
jgi:hypothetical protein